MGICISFLFVNSKRGKKENVVFSVLFCFVFKGRRSSVFNIFYFIFLLRLLKDSLVVHSRVRLRVLCYVTEWRKREEDDNDGGREGSFVVCLPLRWSSTCLPQTVLSTLHRYTPYCTPPQTPPWRELKKEIEKEEEEKTLTALILSHKKPWNSKPLPRGQAFKKRWRRNQKKK